MKSAQEWINEIAYAGCGHPAGCCCDRCRKGRETFLLESDIAEIQRDAIEHGKSLIRDDPTIRKLLDLNSPVTHNPQEDEFYERAERDVKP